MVSSSPALTFSLTMTMEQSLELRLGASKTQVGLAEWLNMDKAGYKAASELFMISKLLPLP